MIKIKEGPELDLAVAEAIGVKCYLSKERDTPLCLVTGPGSEVLNKLNASGVSWRNTFPFQPSIDLNSALAAAEKVSDYFVLNKCEFTEGKWDCKLVATDLATEWYRADTPALAICAAILKANDCLAHKGSEDE